MTASLFWPNQGARQILPPSPKGLDAYYLAEQVALRPHPNATLVVLCANAQDAQRLLEEVSWFAPSLRIALLPDWETLPYDQFSPHQDLVSERLQTLWQLQNQACDVLLLPVSSALYRLCPTHYLNAYSFFFKRGDKMNLESLRERLVQAGYQHVTQVYAAGEYSIRGGLIDLFPMGSAHPYRIDLFDDEIDKIRLFEIESQRSQEEVLEVRLLPAREFPLDGTGQSLFRQQFRAQFEGDPSRCALYKDVSKGIAPTGIEYYLPLFFEQTHTLFDYIDPQACLCLHGDVQGAISQFWAETQSRYRLLSGDKDRPILPPAQLFVSEEQFFSACKAFPRLVMSEGVSAEGERLPALQVDRRAPNPVQALAQFTQTFAGRTLVVAESLGRRETLLALFKEHGLKPAVCETYAQFAKHQARFMLGVSPLQQGYINHTQKQALITESELFAQLARTQQRHKRHKNNTDALLRDLTEVKIGDPVVHEEHGIGRYMGLINLDFGDGDNECMVLHYASEDKLYVPVSHLHLISRYSGADPDNAPLHRLGSGQWEKARRKAMEQVRDTAAELLNIYARRAARTGHAFTSNEQDYAAFADGFGFEETADQAAAIVAVIQDMLKGKPMDRLVCGDVGFGKTEVALRAAFVAVMGGKQVAVLVPTTLLAEQHYQNFCDRFADWPVKIAELSRFRSTKEVNQAIKGLADGSVDIVIGTHKLVQPDVKFKNLGLVIIDEEHRFGVRQKDQFKALRAEVDVLTLTATPIPRTLGMALEGIREFSVIATAPQKRLSVKTFVSRGVDGVIREAVLRELKRGGQVFFLHNEVDTINNMRERLQTLLPEARIGIAHGQLPERELEHIMRDFTQQKFNLLLCSTIIETGIDIPNANTIVINRADKFGLAQLHQLRGRVGRSHHQAYAYLLTPEPSAMTTSAQKRLEAIQHMGDLGSGFFLAMHDMEIRGAGEVLGDSQSGQMHEVGFALYNDMLKHAVNCLKKGIEPDINQPLGVTTEINLHLPALLPDGYCPDVHERLVIYKRLANCETQAELDDMAVELIDRFGLMPPAVKALFASHALRMACKPYGILKLDSHDKATTVQFVAKPPLDPIKMMRMIQQNKTFKLAGPDKLRIDKTTQDLDERLALIYVLLNELAKCSI